MATFTQRKNGWLCQVRRKGFDSVSKTFRTLDEAKEFAYKIENAMLGDELSEPSPVALPVSAKELKTIYRKAIGRAEERGWSDSLTYEEFVDLFYRSQGKCAVSGLFFSGLRVNESRARPYYPSIDRIDSSKGYSKDNVRFVCCAVNIALNDFGDEVLKQIAFGVVKESVLNHHVMSHGNIQKEGKILVLPSQKKRA